MISEFIDRQATNTDLFELEDVLTGEKRQYRIVSKATVTQPGTDLNKATLDPILEAVLSAKGIADSGGSASTGYWVKYDDGTMICWRHQDGMRAINTAVTNTNFYKSDNISLGDFPVSFSAQPAVVVSLYSNAATGVWLSAPFRFGGSSAGNVILYNPTSIPGLLCGLQYIAVGRWK